MKKILIISSGLLSIPSVDGGAIETLIDSLIKVNEIKKEMHITVYSIYKRKAKKVYKNLKLNNCNIVYFFPFMNYFYRIINKLFKLNFSINSFYQKRVIKRANRTDFDFVILENYPELVLKLEKNKTILYIHSDVLNINTDNCKSIVKKAFKFFTVSDFIKQQIINIDENVIDKATTIYNSIDFPFFSNDEYKKYRKIYRNKYNISDKDMVFVFSGRLSFEKGTLELVKAFDKAQLKNSKLLIIGGVWYGTKKGGPYLNLLQSIKNNDIIYTGYINHSDIAKLLCAGDVGVVPSICNEAAGLSAIEFMRSRMYVIASKMGGIPEYLNNNGCMLVDFDNSNQFINDLSKAIVQVYNSDLKDKRMENFEYSKKFDVNKNYEDFCKNLSGDEDER